MENEITHLAKLNALADDVRRLFLDANNLRGTSGITSALQNGCVREMIETNGGDTEFIKLQSDPDCGCDCGDDESCDLCEPKLDNVCSIDECTDRLGDLSPFNNVANLLTNVKKHEYISLAENAYAEVGNKPFKLVAQPDTKLSDGDIDEVARYFYQYIDNFLETNKVTVDEITTAFDLGTMVDVTKTLADEMQNASEVRITESLQRNEQVIERIFDRTDFMREYLEIHKDIVDYPIGVLWVDDTSVVKVDDISSGKLKTTYNIQCNVERVDPCYFWATSDWKLSKPGRAVFRLQQFSYGDLKRWQDLDVVGSNYLSGNIDEFLECHEDGYHNHETRLFSDYNTLKTGMYDVLVCRGWFKKEHVEALNITIPKHYKYDDYIPVQCYYADNLLLRARVIPFVDSKGHMGVYTTLFRRAGQSIWGYSLQDFIYPFAKLYQGAIDAMDQSVGKSVGSITQLDLGLIPDADKYLQRDENGNVDLDLSGDTIIEFDSTKAFGAHNSKGMALMVDQYPSHLGEIIPVLDVVFRELERISGIPSMLVNGSNINSALRTTDNFNAAFSSSAKQIKSLLRETENRILKPAIEYLFKTEAIRGTFEGQLLEANPVILLSDTLSKEMNNDQMLLQGATTIMQLGGQMIPQERLAQLVNTIGRRVYGFSEDMIPDAGLLSTDSQPTPAQEV